MKKIAILLAACIASAACGNSARPVAENTNAAPAAPANGRPQTAIAHTTENGTPPAANSGGTSKWSQGGDPIDTSAMDAEIQKAEKSGDKKAVSQAYLKRADALTQARQYASALGDYRKALKADPSNADAKNWIDQITMVYQSMNRESPKEGEEPPPLPFKKP